MTITGPSDFVVMTGTPAILVLVDLSNRPSRSARRWTRPRACQAAPKTAAASDTGCGRNPGSASRGDAAVVRDLSRAIYQQRAPLAPRVESKPRPIADRSTGRPRAGASG